MKFLISLFLLSSLAWAYEAPQATFLDQKLQTSQNLSLEERLVLFSSYFLDAPYVGGPFGEGEEGKYDQDPLYRFDVFDCTTLVETSMALAYASDFSDFESTINEIRYIDGQVSFVTRKHITSLDWIPNNQEFLEDVTWLVGEDSSDNVKVATAVIKKKAWYQKMGLDRLQLLPLDNETEEEFLERKEKLLPELRAEGSFFEDEVAEVPYLTISSVLKNPALLDNIPQAAVINIVRPNWNLTPYIGTNLNISHQGLAIWKEGKLYFRNASASKTYMKVVDIELIDYLRSYQNSSTVKGINILRLK